MWARDCCPGRGTHTHIANAPCIANKSTLSTGLALFQFPAPSSYFESVMMCIDISHDHKEQRLLLDMSHTSVPSFLLKGLWPANKLTVSQFPGGILFIGRWYFQLNENRWTKCLISWKESFFVRNLRTAHLSCFGRVCVGFLFCYIFWHRHLLVLAKISSYSQLQYVLLFPVPRWLFSLCQSAS